MGSISTKILAVSLFFAVVPVLIAGAYFFVGARSLTAFTIAGYDSLLSQGESYADQYIDVFSEEIVKQRAILTAKSIQHYLAVNHPGESIADLRNESGLRTTAIQLVGRTGFTTVHGRDGISLFHPNPLIEGLNLATFSDQLPEFYSLISTSALQAAEGSYEWRDADGTLGEQYAYCHPIDTYVTCASISLEELNEPFAYLQGIIQADKDDTLTAINTGLLELELRLGFILLAVMIAGIVSILVFVRSTVQNPSKKLIRYISRVTVGEYDYPHGIKTKDEFGRIAAIMHGLSQVLKKYKTGFTPTPYTDLNEPTDEPPLKKEPQKAAAKKKIEKKQKTEAKKTSSEVKPVQKSSEKSSKSTAIAPSAPSQKSQGDATSQEQLEDEDSDDIVQVGSRTKHEDL